MSDAQSPSANRSETAQVVRSILSNRCFACHGPDEEERQGGFRLDVRESFLSEADSGETPVIVGKPAQSELFLRILSEDEDLRMPPPDFGASLTKEETQLVAEWIKSGAALPQHWSFVAPKRPPLPKPQIAKNSAAPWTSHAVDRFVLAKQIEHGLAPSQRASKPELLRRLSLDLIGLPPTPEEVEAFEADDSPNAYLQAVERLLASPRFGEHWARKWLDLARYADSAGYADDPSRTIWAYRDWVIKALNRNQSIEDFTIDQLAGDLVPFPSEEQLVATAFHRNTLTNNEGGTNDEEFRNVAVVDRVNTTMAVWMGVTMACAQCHTHKYDPYTHEEYFKLFAILNQTQDADRRDEKPTISLYSEAQNLLRQSLAAQKNDFEKRLDAAASSINDEYQTWFEKLEVPDWSAAKLARFSSSKDLEHRVLSTGQVQIALDSKSTSDTYRVTLDVTPSNNEIRALGIRTLPVAEFPRSGAGLGNGNFVISSVSAMVQPKDSKSVVAKYVRVELPGKSKILSLAEVQAFSRSKNVALGQKTRQISTAFAGVSKLAVDGKTSGAYEKDKTTTHTATTDDPWWEVELKADAPIDSIQVWNRTDNKLQNRLNGARVLLLNSEREVVFSHTIRVANDKNSIKAREFRKLAFGVASADYEQTGFAAQNVLDNNKKTGWAVEGAVDQPHLLTLVLAEPVRIMKDEELILEIEQQSPHKRHLLGSFQIETSRSPSVADWSSLPKNFQRQLSAGKELSSEQSNALTIYFTRSLAPSTRPVRTQLNKIAASLSSLRPETSVPILREVADSQKRDTFVQIRGNYKSLGKKVTAGTPEIFHDIVVGSGRELPNRLDLAKWLVDRNNPLTARVWVNRLWETLFGIGIVRSSEEFGSQGDRPSHPELLDWLAVEFMETDWDLKAMLRLLVTSETYQQTSQVSLATLSQDADNIWLSRGPRVRLSAEMVRDQALSAAGLMSAKMYGPPVRPPQPNMGLTAAFGSQTDWKTSEGEDRYRRGLYTTWRRSNPYPSMATFDAPSREVCTLRRDSTNTPLQALVTLNDPGFVEAAQGLARRVLYHSEARTDTERLARLFELATSRRAYPAEIEALSELLSKARSELQHSPDDANRLATDPIGPLPHGANAIELAAFTSVCNVVLNLDEVLMKR